MGQELGRAMNMTMDDVIQVLMDNHIPVPWIDHSYAFSLHYLDHHHDGCNPFHGLFDDVDDNRLTCLDAFRVPPIIPEWDGWWVPSNDDIVRVHTLQLCKEKEDRYCQDDSDDWLQVGDDPYFYDLCNCRPPMHVYSNEPADEGDHLSPPPPATTGGPPHYGGQPCSVFGFQGPLYAE